jgi:antitoxin (DNA-binding transcriptional repressor) of toxin-antitoxin stability system
VEAAESGEPTVIAKHGKPAVMVVPIGEGRKLYPQISQKISWISCFGIQAASSLSETNRRRGKWSYDRLSA